MKLMDVCNKVLDASAAWKAGKRKSPKVTVGDVVFDLRELGMCQRAARKAYEAATGRAMPGAACCAGQTYRNLKGMPKELFAWRDTLAQPWAHVVGNLQPGDFLYFSGGGKCSTCKGAVGHVGVWMGNDQMFQNTSRSQLGTTREGPTASQQARFVGAFRFKAVS
jgi:cell wall-associated NlpC family hydrolase